MHFLNVRSFAGFRQQDKFSVRSGCRKGISRPTKPFFFCSEPSGGMVSHIMNRPTYALIVGATLAFGSVDCFGEEDVAKVRRQAEAWRLEHRIIDLHQHINGTTQHLSRAVRLMDSVGIGIAVNLSGGTVTRGTNDAPSAFERNKELADRLAPGRFLQYMNLDYKGWDQPDFAERAVKQVEEGHRLGAAGLKEYKRLGLFLRDGEGKLIRIDDARLDPVWKRCGELNMPVSIHVADPRAFWLPFNSENERWKELKDHRPWWFGNTH